MFARVPAADVILDVGTPSRLFLSHDLVLVTFDGFTLSTSYLMPKSVPIAASHSSASVDPLRALSRR
jgi:hypothetical protein